MDSPAIKGKKIKRYFRLLAQTGAKCASCRGAGFGSKTLRRFRRDQEDWVSREDEAIMKYVESCEIKVDKRAFRGVPKGIYYEGVKVGSELHYSDSLAMFRLKGLAPDRYADRSKATVEHGGQVIIHLPDNGRGKTA